jgi:hypothetical protein
VSVQTDFISEEVNKWLMMLNGAIVTVKIRHDSELGDALMWIIEHNGIIEERWEQQFRWNAERQLFEKDLKRTIDKINDQLGHQRSQVAFIAGCSALVGAIAIPAIQFIFGSL